MYVLYEKIYFELRHTALSVSAISLRYTYHIPSTYRTVYKVFIHVQLARLPARAHDLWTKRKFKLILKTFYFSSSNTFDVMYILIKYTQKYIQEEYILT